MKNNGIFESVKQKLFWLVMLTAMLMVSQVTFAEDWACAYVQTWDGSSNASYKVDNNCDFVSQTSIDNKDFGTLGENFYIKFYALRNSDENDNGLLKYQIDNGDWQEKKLIRDGDYYGNPKYWCELNVIGFGLSSGPHTIQFCIRVPHSNDEWWINNGGSNYTIKFTIGTSTGGDNAGFFDENAALMKFVVDGNKDNKKEYYLNKKDVATINIGVVETLIFDEFQFNTWKKKDQGNICGEDSKTYYSIYSASSSSSNWKETPHAVHTGDEEKDGSINQNWKKSDMKIDLTEGLSQGKYILELYVKTKGKKNSNNGCDDEFTLNNEKPGENYKFTFEVSSSVACDLQSKGDNITAGTVVFFDNSNTNFGNVFVSIPHADNANIGTADIKTYQPQKDKWYGMLNVGNNLWRAEITEPSAVGKLNFWNTNLSSYDNPNDCAGAYLVAYDKNNNKYTPKGKICQATENIKLYTIGSWEQYKSVSISGSTNDIDKSDCKPLILYAFADGVTGSEYTWSKSTDGKQWDDFATTSEPNLTIEVKDLPDDQTQYRVKFGGVNSSSAWVVNVQVSCGAETQGTNVFKMDFGTVTNYKDRKELDGMNSTYTYQPYPYKINDGYYALVADPYWCGCGGGDKMNESVEDCMPSSICTDETETCSAWYRPYWYKTRETTKARTRDHTINNQMETGVFGLMLMINYKETSNTTAFEHILTDTEKEKMVPGSNVRLSVWMASAAKESSGSEVKMTIELLFSTDKVNWQSLKKQEGIVKHHDDWKIIQTADFVLGDQDGDYKLIIYSSGYGSGNGNDVLIDDISLDVCVPRFSVAFYDKNDIAYLDGVLSHTDSTLVIKAPKIDFGSLGDDPCIMLFQYDSLATNDKKYKYVSPMTLDGNYYKTTVGWTIKDGIHAGDRYFSTIPSETINFVAVATTQANCTNDVISKIESGIIIPDITTLFVKSSTWVNYSMECSDKQPKTKIIGNTTVCESGGKKKDASGKSTDLPNVEVEFNAVTPYVYYSVVEDGSLELTAQDVALTSTEAKTGKFVVNLNDYDNKIDRTVGSHNISIKLYEKTSESSDVKVCEKSASITLTVVNKPNGTLDQLVTKCDGVEKSVSVTAHYADKYQWQINTSPATAVAANWTDIPGATSVDYTIPKDAADGSQYRVGLSNSDGYCEAQYSNEITLKVEKCDDVSLTLSPAAKSICKGEEIEFTASLTNLGDVATDVSVTEDASEMSGFEFISAIASQGSFSGNVWTINGFAKGATATLTLKYKAKVDTEVKRTEKVYVSKMGEAIWDSYARQSDDNMKASSVISAKEVTDMPTLSDPYDECQTPGVKALSDFVTSDKTELHWYSDAELQNEVVPAEFDMNIPTPDPTPTTRGNVYYVTNQESGKCVSYPAAQSVTVRKAPAPIVTKDFIKCTNDKKLDLQTLVTNYDAENNYSYYCDGVILNDKVVDLESGASKTYSVKAALGDCESDMADMVVSVKTPVLSVLLQEKDGGEYDLDGVPTVKIGLGATTEKVLTINPPDASNYTTKWYMGDNEFDGLFPRSPYVDHVYKAVVVDECGNTHIATAGTQVEWPTIFMPYDNGTNKDFVVGIDGGIEIYVFDRTGNMVAHSLDGWDGFANQNGNTKIAMPGLYYYKAILPDGSVKKGTVEVFKK